MKDRHAKAIAHISKADKKLARFILKCTPCAIRPNYMQNVFEALMESIVYQQLSGKAAATILSRVKAIYCQPDTPTINTRHGKALPFPTPEQLLATPDEVLRSAGLSGNKTKSVKDLAAKTLDGTVPDVATMKKMADDDIINHLTQVRGIGRWTVEMILLFNLYRPDVWPVDDLGVRKGYMKLRGLDEMPKPKELMALGECYKPHRSVAAWYMWRAAENIKEKPRVASPKKTVKKKAAKKQRAR
ncbi:MAG TPA: DNA-3-methyladenine glycosylase [Candidatus Koribacter sp.]|jgi:DNA-3-methyladenine glycosylase II